MYISIYGIVPPIRLVWMTNYLNEILEEAFFHKNTYPIPNKRFIFCSLMAKRLFQTETTLPSETQPASNLTATTTPCANLSIDPSIHPPIHQTHSLTH